MTYPSWILERSFGGIGVAVSPVSGFDKGKWPNGQSSPMSQDACNSLVYACNAAEGTTPAQMVFLVGGAGNGKSKLAADVVASVGGTRVGASNGFAQRSYEFSLPNGRTLRVINDATIPPKDKHEAPLRRDLACSLDTKEHFLGCINRGVLIGEVNEPAAPGASDLDLVAKAITGWLLDGRSPTLESSNPFRISAAPLKGGDHYKYATISKGETVHGHVHVVYMDRASLLEEWKPAPAAHDLDGPLSTGKIGSVGLLSKARRETPSAFESCLSKLAAVFEGELSANDLDPIHANASTLKNEDIARGWCSMMRGAEILTGTHFSYRELWALAAHSLVGPVTSDTYRTLSEQVAVKVAIVRQATGTERLQALMRLGELRSHMLLFEAGTAMQPLSLFKGIAGEGFAWPKTSSDALRAVQLADPIRQFGASDGADAARLSTDLDAINEGQYPGAKIAKEDPLVGAYWCHLDAEIEAAIKAAIAPGETTLPLSDRSELLSWYGRYMYRLVALARGWPAYVSVANEWQNAWKDANRSNRLSPEIEEAVLEILVPYDEHEKGSYYTFLQPRVTQGKRNSPKVRLELPRKRIAIEATTAGDRIDIQINLNSATEERPAAEATLDFHFLREAMARRDGHGFTDSLLLIEPRIERLRAAMVAAQLAAEDDRNRFSFSDRAFSKVR